MKRRTPLGASHLVSWRPAAIRGAVLGVLLVGTFIAVNAPASSGDTPPVDRLTGKSVGIALGLTPDEDGDGTEKCPGWYAEYDDGNGGYCLAGVTDDPVEEVVLAVQITGYERTDAVEAYAAAVVAWRTTSVADGSPEQAELMLRVAKLRDQLENTQAPVENN